MSQNNISSPLFCKDYCELPTLEDKLFRVLCSVSNDAVCAFAYWTPCKNGRAMSSKTTCAAG